MTQTANYKTKQRQAILDCIASLRGTHVTVSQIAEYLHEKNNPVGVTTIYRHLDKLVQEGKVKKYTIDNTTSACFAYIDKHKSCNRHFHLKCESCGKLIHLDCDFLPQLEQHIFDHHKFKINPNKTVFYGTCKACQPH